MEITLFNYSGIPQVIRKNLTTITTLNGQFRNPYSLMEPVIEIAGTDNQALFTQKTCNMIGCEGVYYYVTDFTIMPNGIIAVNCHIDVLMTYKDEINTYNVMLERYSEELSDLNDSNHPISPFRNIEYVDFPVRFSEAEDDGVYLLITSQSGYTLV